MVVKPILSKMVSLSNKIQCSPTYENCSFILNISGSGLEDINGVFEESNTYQPSVPSSEAEIIVS